MQREDLFGGQYPSHRQADPGHHHDDRRLHEEAQQCTDQQAQDQRARRPCHGRLEPKVVRQGCSRLLDQDEAEHHHPYREQGCRECLQFDSGGASPGSNYGDQLRRPQGVQNGQLDVERHDQQQHCRADVATDQDGKGTAWCQDPRAHHADRDEGQGGNRLGDRAGQHAPQTRRPTAAGPLLGALAHAPIGQSLQVLSQQIQTREEQPEAAYEPADDCYHCPISGAVGGSFTPVTPMVACVEASGYATGVPRATLPCCSRSLLSPCYPLPPISSHHAKYASGCVSHYVYVTYGVMGAPWPRPASVTS